MTRTLAYGKGATGDPASDFAMDEEFETKETRKGPLEDPFSKTVLF